MHYLITIDHATHFLFKYIFYQNHDRFSNGELDFVLNDDYFTHLTAPFAVVKNKNVQLKIVPELQFAVQQKHHFQEESEEEEVIGEEEEALVLDSRAAEEVSVAPLVVPKILMTFEVSDAESDSPESQATEETATLKVEHLSVPMGEAKLKVILDIWNNTVYDSLNINVTGMS